MKRDAFTIPLAFPGELIIDNFAGGGGTSTGLEKAFGRPVDIAINHNPEALAMHAINHPHTLHLCESVWTVNPIKVTRNQPVGLVWLSPDCKHFSKAKGGTPVAKHIRGLAWVGMRWVALCKPRVLMLENVEEFQTWGPLLVDADGNARPDPARKGKTFESFVRQLRAHGYVVDWRELRACDQGTPTIRKRLFLIARRDGLPICWPEQTHGEPTTRAVLAGKLAPYRTAAECIDFTIEGTSIFGRKKDLATNTLRRVAKGLWRHVLTSPKPFIVGTGGPTYAGRPTGTDQPMGTLTTDNHRAVTAPVLAPYLNEHANASNQRTMAADEPLRTVCAQVKGGHFSVVAPSLQPFVVTNTTGHPGAPTGTPLPTVTTGGHHALAAAMVTPLRGTSDAHLGAHDVRAPLSTVSAGGTHHAMVAGHITKFNTGSVGTGLDEPLSTVTAGGSPKRPSTGITQGVVGAHLITIGYGEREGQPARAQDIEKPIGTVVAANKHAVVAAHLVDMGHGETCSTGAKRWGSGVRDLEIPLNTITASSTPSALVTACLEQANGGFYDGDGRAADAPISTITAAGSNQRLIAAYAVKYYSSGGQWQELGQPMHTVPTKDRMGLVQVLQVPADSLAPELRERARQCAELLHTHLPEHFTQPAEMVLVWHAGLWWVLVDITLRMLKPRELFNAQGFPADYVIHEIPDPALLFGPDGHQVANPLAVPRIPLSATAQVRMCGNSVCPPQAEALVRANFGHEAAIYGVAA